MRNLISGLALFLVLTANANARDYTVQVGAYQTLTQQTIDRAEQHGEVFQYQGADNLKRLSIGRFKNKAGATNMRDTLLASGFTGAFITSLKSNSSTASISSHSSTINHSPSVSNSRVQSTVRKNNSNYTIDDLNSDERYKASYLDGQLRILSEGNFYTVEQYRQRTGY